jgi:hypothetical protein
MKQQFDGKEEKELPPTHHDSRFVFEMVSNISVRNISTVPQLQ